MSITDPVAARRARQARRRPVRRAVVTVVLLATSLVAGASWGWVHVIGFEEAGAGLSTTAFVASLLAWFSFLVFSIVTFGSWRAAPFVLALALLLLGGGLLWPGLQAGESVLAFPGWLALLFVVLAAALATAASVGMARRARREESDRLVRAGGTEAVATVTAVPPGPDPGSRGLWARVAFTFTDLAGTRRWVERSLLIREAGDVRVGDTTRLWYDAREPGNDRLIVVELAVENALRVGR